MWGKYRAESAAAPVHGSSDDAMSFEPPTKKQLDFAKKLGIMSTPDTSKLELAEAIENAVTKNPTLQRKLQRTDEEM